MVSNEDMNYLKVKIDLLLQIVGELKTVFPQKSFTLDGHLIGSIGEVLAKYYYDIELYSSSSHPVHDAYDSAGRQVQIKITQGTSIDISEEPEYLIVLFLNKKNGKVYEVYNGRGSIAMETRGKLHKNGWYSLSLVKLYNVRKCSERDKIEQINEIPQWCIGMKNEN